MQDQEAGDKPLDRERFIQELDGRTRRTLTQAQELLAKPREDLGWHHDLGTKLAGILSEAVYGTYKVDRLAGILGLSRIRVYQHLGFIERYPEREEAVALSERGLKWAMVVALLTIKDPNQRARLQEQAVERSWSVDRLRLEIRRVQGPRQASRKAQHSSARQSQGKLLLGRLDDLVAGWLALREECEEGEGNLLFEQVRNLSQRERGQGSRSGAEDLVKSLRQVQGFIDDLIRQITGK
jgi:hypothetical protein